MSESRLLLRFNEVCQGHAARSCVIDSEGDTSFDEVCGAAQRVARHLCLRGGQGRRVALLIPPSAGWVQAFWGGLLSGALMVPLVQSHPKAELARSLAAAKVTCVVVSRKLRKLAEEAVLLAAAEPSMGRPPEVVELESLLTAEPASPAPFRAPVTGAQPGVLFFTSGTTGVPKRALVTHDQLAQLARLVREAWAVGPNDRLAHCLPLHHTHGLGIAFLVCMLAGASQHFLPKFDTNDVWSAFQQSTMFMAVPTMHKRLLDAYAAQPAQVRRNWAESARRQRLITSGSAALPASLALKWADLVGSIPLERFGMTEVGVALSNPLEGERRLGSCGQVLPGMQVRIVDDAGNDLPQGVPGEIWIQGPSVFSGYDADPTATQSSFSGGWFKSGDTAMWLDDGYVKILGRTSSDIIKSGGYKLSALEIEEAIRRYPGVDDAAVVAVVDEDFGEAAVAVVVANGELESDSLRAFLKAELAPYKVPRRIHLASELPRNVLGKVTKHVLREQLLEKPK